MRIIYTVQNLVELFQVDEHYIKSWTRIGVLPALPGYPLRYNKNEIDEWLDAGNLDRYRPNVVRAEKVKGVWEHGED